MSNIKFYFTVGLPMLAVLMILVTALPWILLREDIRELRREFGKIVRGS
jgi:hypothetical protein